jgi:hypothetical protein
MNNYWKNVRLAEKMWLRKSNLDMYSSMVSNFAPSSMKKALFEGVRGIGLKVANEIVNTKKI